MKKLGLAVLLLVASTALAHDNAYKFRAVYNTDHFEFGEADGAHWRRLKLGCGKVECEVQLNASNAVGAASSRISDEKTERDLGFTRIDDKTMKVRCLRRSGCTVRAELNDQKIDKSLARGESIDIPSGALIEFKGR